MNNVQVINQNDRRAELVIIRGSEKKSSETKHVLCVNGQWAVITGYKVEQGQVKECIEKFASFEELISRLEKLSVKVGANVERRTAAYAA